MGVRFTYEDTDGSTRFKAWALPLIVAAICVPIVAGFSAGSQGAAIGAGIAALTGATVIVLASRSQPFAAMEVARAESPGRRILVLAAIELEAEAAGELAAIAAGADDVRVVVPIPSSRLDAWLSSEDDANTRAREMLAGTAGALTAAGLPVSGSVGDRDMVQAAEDELRSFAADEVVVYSGPGTERSVEKLRHRLALPLTRLPAG